MVGNAVDLSLRRLARGAPSHPLPLDSGDQVYITEQLSIIAEVFGVRAVPDVPLAYLSGRDMVSHCLRLRETLQPVTPEQFLAFGRLQSVFRLLGFACDMVRDRAGGAA